MVLHCSQIVASFEAYPGLVELGVGLIPAGGGCKEMAKRAAIKANGADLMNFIRPYFEAIATATVAGSAPDALNLGYLKEKDTWIMHSNEVLYAALNTIKALQAANYHPSLQQTFPVMGREGHARLQLDWLIGLRVVFISQYDYELANQLAWSCVVVM